MHEYRYRIGGISVRVSCPFVFDAEQFGLFEEDGTSAADMDVKVDATSSDAYREMRQRYSNTKFWYEGPDAHLFFDGVRRCYVFMSQRRQEAIHTLSGAIRILLSSYLLVHRKGVMIHASGTIYGGSAYVFWGESGSGKTTMARFAQAAAATVLNDEAVILTLDEGNRILAWGTPFYGEGMSDGNASAPVRAMCVLTKSNVYALCIAEHSSAFAQLYHSGVIAFPFALSNRFSYVMSMLKHVPLVLSLRTSLRMSWQRLMDDIHSISTDTS